METALYTILYKKSVAKDLRKLNPTDRFAVIQKILNLALEPFPVGCVKLQGLTGIYRVRQGDYRIIYQVHDNVLTLLVIKVGHRREVYRKP